MVLSRQERMLAARPLTIFYDNDRRSARKRRDRSVDYFDLDGNVHDSYIAARRSSSGRKVESTE